MVIIWRGWGIVTGLIICGSLIVLVTLEDWHRFPDWVTYFAAAIPAAIANALFVAPFAGNDTLFFIPVKYWTFIILAYPVIGTIRDLVH